MLIKSSGNVGNTNKWLATRLANATCVRYTFFTMHQEQNPIYCLALFPISLRLLRTRRKSEQSNLSFVLRKAQRHKTQIKRMEQCNWIFSMFYTFIFCLCRLCRHYLDIASLSQGSEFKPEFQCRSFLHEKNLIKHGECFFIRGWIVLISANKCSLSVNRKKGNDMMYFITNKRLVVCIH